MLYFNFSIFYSLAMKRNRMDHACAMVTINEVEGILVSGGVDEHDNTHDSVEFYNLRTREWTDMAPLKVARTEHGMGVIGGIVTVIGKHLIFDFYRICYLLILSKCYTYRRGLQN